MRTAPSSGGSSGPAHQWTGMVRSRLAASSRNFSSGQFFLRAAGERMDHGEFSSRRIARAGNPRNAIARARARWCAPGRDRNRWRACRRLRAAVPERNGTAARAGSPARGNPAGWRHTRRRWNRNRATRRAGAAGGSVTPSRSSPVDANGARAVGEPHQRDVGEERPRLPGNRPRRHSMAGRETMKSPMAPGRMISLRNLRSSIAKTEYQAIGLSTANAPA